MTMGDELSGKVAIVTGGASGIGRAAVERFLAEGARVVIADIDEEGGEELASALGDAVAYQRTDVSVADDVQAAVDLAVERFGRLDVMFNNAGIGSKFERLIDNDLSDFDRVIGVDLKGVMLGTQRAARQMAQQGGGAIVNTASIAATTGGAGPIVYRAAKAAVVQFSKSAAIDLAPHRIRVNCIAPGHIPTRITNYDLDAVIQTMQPLQRHGQVADVAEAVLYLVSDRSAQITGIVMPIDGGTSAGPPVTQLRDLMRGVQAGKEKAAAKEQAAGEQAAEGGNR
jgi:NAD(P)-dependent dehydrogenase (short-subunit alcohol dehydrogenase family)